MSSRGRAPMRGPPMVGRSVQQSSSRQATLDPEKLYERIHKQLQDSVGGAVAKVMNQETQWSESELTKRVVRYIYNSAKNPDLLTMPWEEAVAKLVDQAMHSYHASCGEKQWFFEIDLNPSFVTACWEVCRAGAASQPRSPKFTYSKLQEAVNAAYEDYLDRVLLRKAMWDATAATFKDATVQNKVYNALSKTWEPCLNDTQSNGRPMADLERVESFAKKWIDDSMRRAWCALENTPQTLSEQSAIRLFQNLVAPFGDEHPFSCIPGVLTEQIGRPPRDWQFIKTAVKSLFASWKAEEQQRPAKRRKTSSSQPAVSLPPAKEELDEGECEDECEGECEDECEDEDGPPMDQSDVASDDRPDGHPQCTSSEDCIGSPSERLVRHVLEGDPGDLYCEVCWKSFLGQNSVLEGIWDDDGMPFVS
eukprot:gnl/TRDRNA2_/TRDRNA2_126840_c1_seq1.p1 gnl/TRDRNA2_/TRDRNA2_126840_c1~~gnl/TRDRNA2_/TRDRNA2_126840_c1_seq1.p1  ORF type:complete len:421 (-),score=66.67 gnl/TRDRNA2_/TRDRNA2_126840_c1_seq1:60-1322(-)